jgi:hypothetical protein
MIVFDGVVPVLLHHMTGRGQQFIEQPQVRRRPIGRHLHRLSGVLERPGEEPAVAVKSRLAEASTSMTWPCRSIARYR